MKDKKDNNEEMEGRVIYADIYSGHRYFPEGKEFNPLNNKRNRIMKTPMQELIEWMNTAPSSEQPISIYDKATELLEKEKQVIIDAYNEGYLVGNGSNKTAAKYYNETFK